MSRQSAVLAAFPCHILSGQALADEILLQVRQDVGTLKSQEHYPRLVSIIFGGSAAAGLYVRNQRRIAAKVGIEFVELEFSADVTQQDAVSEIGRLNADPLVTGIIIQRPVPDQLAIKQLQRAVSPSKDVEGMHPESIGQIVYGLSDIGPCTAIAALELLKSTGLTIQGLEVVVIGHSEIVGKPLAFLLMAEGATVTVCHHMTRSVAVHSRRADAVIVAVGRPKLIGSTMIKPGAAVIDVGINQVTDEHGKQCVVGDVDYDALQTVAGWLTPVPGGVGPVTLAVLMRNTVHAARRQHRQRGAMLPVPASLPGDIKLDRVILRDLDLSARLGVYVHELEGYQPIRINMQLEVLRGGPGIGVVCCDTIATQVKTLVESGHVRLVEELAERISDQCLSDARVRSVQIRIEKLSAVISAAGAGVEITRRASV